MYKRARDSLKLNAQAHQYIGIAVGAGQAPSSKQGPTIRVQLLREEEKGNEMAISDHSMYVLIAKSFLPFAIVNPRQQEEHKIFFSSLLKGSSPSVVNLEEIVENLVE